jgi:NosR/NirI family nitrous oxide reductase transcriptional regulator
LKKKLPYILLILLIGWNTILFAQDRFPRPEFESGYIYPVEQMPLQRSLAWEYIDVSVLFLALCVTTWLALKKRSRQGLIWVAVFSLAYFGFFREGCICAVGSVQNTFLSSAVIIRPVVWEGVLCRSMSIRCNSGTHRL